MSANPFVDLLLIHHRRSHYLRNHYQHRIGERWVRTRETRIREEMCDVNQIFLNHCPYQTYRTYDPYQYQMIPNHYLNAMIRPYTQRVMRSTP